MMILQLFALVHVVFGVDWTTDFTMDIYTDPGCTTVNTAQPTMTLTTTSEKGCFSYGSAYLKMTCSTSGKVEIWSQDACSNPTNPQPIVGGFPWASGLDFLKRQSCTSMLGLFGGGPYGKLRKTVPDESFPACGPMDATMDSYDMQTYGDAACSSPSTASVMTFQLASHQRATNCFDSQGGVSYKPVCDGETVLVHKYNSAACQGTATADFFASYPWENAYEFFLGGCVEIYAGAGSFGKLSKEVVDGSYPVCGSTDGWSFVSGANHRDVSAGSILILGFVMILSA